MEEMLHAFQDLNTKWRSGRLRASSTVLPGRAQYLLDRRLGDPELVWTDWQREKKILPVGKLIFTNHLTDNQSIELKISLNCIRTHSIHLQMICKDGYPYPLAKKVYNQWIL